MEKKKLEKKKKKKKKKKHWRKLFKNHFIFEFFILLFGKISPIKKKKATSMEYGPPCLFT